MKNKLIASCLWLLLLVVAACNNQNPKIKGGNLPVLTIGYQNSPISTLLMVAKNKGYFDSTGITVNMQSFTAGKFAVTALVSGKDLDLALSGELPIVLATLQGNQLKVITQVVSSTTNECRIVALKDGDLNTPEKYFSKRRKIATSLKGTPEYFLSTFIKKYNINKDKIDIVSMKPEDMTSALLSKNVDGIAIFDPVASIASIKIGNDGIVFQDSSIYSALYLISGLQKTIDTRKEDLVKFVKGLEMASLYCKNNPDSAKMIVAGYTKLDKAILDNLWGNYAFDISLTEKLNTYFNDEAQWVIRNGDAPASTIIPDFKKTVINTSILQEVNASKIKLQ